MNHFDKTRRLLTKADYNCVFAQAKKLVTSEFTVLCRDNMLGHPRLGLAISKKMIPKAHDRNRVKRLLRENFRTSQIPAIDLIFLAKPGLAKVKNKTITTNIGLIWDKLTVLYAI